MHKITEVLISESELMEKVEEMAKAIENDYKGEDIFIIGVLKGACVFVSDLMRKINLNVELDFMSVSSYGKSTKSSGVVKILKDLDLEIENKHVIIVEDIIDTGLTLKYLTENLRSRNPKSLKVCTLLDKPDRRKCHLDVDYIGFTIPDRFIVGYGIDCAEMYRNLPFIGIVSE
ncbi:hypoxanthine phosphoribosyltransferase [Peptoclostridium litorale DSM 5388]|uniref:Hypoxanthine phosphoribosyltransferase n=1 Tax=Peptoclostridium litorale DSM 5388 TaxID=1121324 RepID=A0A069RGI5_PEPLI|nr:hypoxanthine phosphoribosyltransferase [Peptoclostridium litorale]KDR96129.1 hypoxanthine phosphoribosyltransferase Hpt [Peptoclostridium litorale DSM 5388]SIO04010.1 hypoxanthine phosphoribosyltransferase [Peptoclostridium litorale DSM 5388]